MLFYFDHLFFNKNYNDLTEISSVEDLEKAIKLNIHSIISSDVIGKFCNLETLTGKLRYLLDNIEKINFSFWYLKIENDCYNTVFYYKIKKIKTDYLDDFYCEVVEVHQCDTSVRVGINVHIVNLHDLLKLKLIDKLPDKLLLELRYLYGICKI